MQRAIEILESAIKWMDNPREQEAVQEAIAVLQQVQIDARVGITWHQQEWHDHGC